MRSRCSERSWETCSTKPTSNPFLGLCGDNCVSANSTVQQSTVAVLLPCSDRKYLRSKFLVFLQSPLSLHVGRIVNTVPRFAPRILAEIPSKRASWSLSRLLRHFALAVQGVLSFARVLECGSNTCECSFLVFVRSTSSLQHST